MNGNCPTELNLHPSVADTCVAKCPADKGFEYRTVSGALKCVYKADPTNAASVNPLPKMGFPPGKNVLTAPVISGSYEQLKTLKPDLYKQYTTEVKRFNDELAVVNAKIDKDQKIAVAFKTLQDTENARDSAPDAYQSARMAYYTLVKGDKWVDEERARVAKAEVDPVVNAYSTRYTDVQNRMGQQTKTIDIVNAVKDKLLDVQEEFGRTVGVFDKQLKEVRNQINIERQKKVEEVSGVWDFVETALNILLILVLIFAIVAVGRAFLKKDAPSSVYTPAKQFS